MHVFYNMYRCVCVCVRGGGVSVRVRQCVCVCMYMYIICELFVRKCVFRNRQPLRCLDNCYEAKVTYMLWDDIEFRSLIRGAIPRQK